MKADKKEIQTLLKTARGQIEGILKMIEEDRYCVDISNQLLAVNSIIKRANTKVLDAHIRCCVSDAVQSGNADEKLDEISTLIEKIAK